MTTLKDILNPISQNDTVTTITLIILSLIVLYKLFFSGAGNHHLPPGPRGLPIVGNLLSLDPELHTHFSDLSKIYGPIFKLRLGTKLCVVVSSPELAEQILKDNDVVFANRDISTAARIVLEGASDIIWSPYGPEWRMLRKAAAIKMLSNIALDSVYHLRRSEIRNTVRNLYKRAGSKVDFGEQMFLTILNVVTNMLWGGTMEEEEREWVGSEFRHLISEFIAIFIKPNVSDYFPRLARFDLQGLGRDMRRISSRLNRLLDRLISKRTEKMKNKNIDHGEGNKDFLQYLLRLKDEEDSNPPFTMGHVKILLLDMVTTASDTSSNAIEFTMAEIINQPQIMKKVQQELDDVVGRDNIVEESHLHKLIYLQAVMKESLRLHPISPLLAPHSPSQTSNIGGFTVPKGSCVFINVWSIHRSSSYWENPLKFDPERFLSNNNNDDNNGTKFDFSGADFRYFPFGSGRRICAGVAMAERMVLYNLASFLHSFDWEVPAGEKLDLSENFNFSLKKKMPLVVVPTPRLSNPKLYA